LQRALDIEPGTNGWNGLMERHPIFIGARADGPHQQRLAAVGYLAAIPTVGVYLWGIGSVGDVTALQARACANACERLYAELAGDVTPLPVDVICESPGFWERVVQFDINEAKHALDLPGKSKKPHNEPEIWTQLSRLRIILSLPTPRRPMSGEESKRLDSVRMALPAISKRAAHGDWLKAPSIRNEGEERLPPNWENGGRWA
jgi:hypothetical protein